MVQPPEIDGGPVAQTLRWSFRPISFMEKARRAHGETFGVTFIGFETPLYMTSEPAAIKTIYSNRDNTLPPGRNLTLEPLVGPRSLLLLEGSEHLARRKLMLPPFHGERMRAYENEIAEITEREIDSWPLHEEFRLHPRMQGLTLEVILRVVFGVTDPERLERLRQSLRRVLNTTASPIMQLVGLAARRFSERGPYKRFLEQLAVADGLLYEEIAEKRADPGLDEREDILSMLVGARFEDGEGMDNSELRDQLMTLLLAGHETTATALAWTFDLLLHNPAARKRLRAEIAEGGDEYLGATITEALRLRPVVPIAGRRLVSELEVDGYRLPAGADITPAIYLAHTRADVYPEPYAFRPERFLGDGPDTYSWIPFGGGVRRCIGAAFAEFEMRIVLAQVLARCELRAARDRPQGLTRRNITFSPRHGTPVTLVERRAAPAEPVAV